MKKFTFLFVLGFLVLSFCGFSQTQTFEYTYDSSGNRIYRGVITLKSGQINVTAESIQPEIVKASMESYDIVIYPNPTKGNLKVDISNLENEEANLYIFNIQGKLILNHVLKSKTRTINLSTHPPGMYILKVNIGNKYSEWKIIKE